MMIRPGVVVQSAEKPVRAALAVTPVTVKIAVLKSSLRARDPISLNPVTNTGAVPVGPGARTVPAVVMGAFWDLELIVTRKQVSINKKALVFMSYILFLSS
jgi:hypothetical protein